MAIPKNLMTGNKSFGAGNRFYLPSPCQGAIEQTAALLSSGYFADAELISRLKSIPRAVWISGGSPRSVEQQVRDTVERASGMGTVATLVAYNIPFRDCAQFSAGGAKSISDYKEWIDSFATGIGENQTVVILEPDSLGIIPFYRPYGSQAYEWCQPVEADVSTAATERFNMLNYAVERLKAHKNTSVYMDGTHSAWLDPGDAAQRLIEAGVAQADGFFLNASNYQYTLNLIHYGNWISASIAYATQVNLGDFLSCPSQYANEGPIGTKIAELIGPHNGMALNPFGVWSDDENEPSLNTSGISQRYSNMLGSVQPHTHYVIDTSRNGRGPWEPPTGIYPDPQAWCNPPGRGLGHPPTTDLVQPLLDAYLWIKIPGESDGECTRGLGQPGSTVDPVWGQVDPPAGQWFPQMAVDLARNSNPPL